MRFVDYVSIEVVAGKGGDGIISFRREAHVDKGGPDGGDGGWGGSIYFVGDSGMNTLLPFYQTKKIFGYNGENGRPKRQTGANGKDIFIKVPLGTQVFLKKSLICDIILEKKYLIAKGGRGGLGNFHFRNSKNKAPRISENGELGQNFYLDLQLKVMADIGLVGKPNAGKSTLLSLISNSKPKIANYEFTTLAPQLGVVKIYENSFVTADLPGLIQGASSGKGMGIIFLKHIERCRAIVHVIDFGSDNKNPIKDFIEIKSELEKFNKKLLDLNQIVIANKCDLPNFQFNLANFKRKFPKIKIIKSSLISAKQNEINIIKEKMFGLLGEKQKKLEIQEINTSKIEFNLKAPFLIKSRNNGFFEITGELIQKIIQKIPLNSQENILRFNAKVKKIGLWDELIKKGIKPGDLVRIYEFEFHWN